MSSLSNEFYYSITPMTHKKYLINYDLAQIIKDLEAISFDFSKAIPLYNPMEEFVKYVKTKEIAHSKIIGDLLDVNGQHECKSIFLDSFLQKFLEIDVKTITETHVVRERPIKRQHTSGDDRYIDIFIEYKDRSGNWNAVIIENKLNNAVYQPSQLIDYNDAIQKDKYSKIDIICFHKYVNSEEGLMQSNDIPIKIVYPGNLADWLFECLTKLNNESIQSIISYIYFLRNLNIENRMLENAKIILNLEPDLFQKVKIIGESYLKLKNDPLNLIKDALTSEYPKLKFRYYPHTSHIEIWDDEVWKKSNFEIAIWLDGDNYSLYLVSERKDETSYNLLETSGYYMDHNSTNWGYRWFEAPKENCKRYQHPDKFGFKQMIEEIKRLLALLFYPKENKFGTSE